MRGKLYSDWLSAAYFNSLSNALEIRTRTRSVNDKITYAAEVCHIDTEALRNAYPCTDAICAARAIDGGVYLPRFAVFT